MRLNALRPEYQGRVDVRSMAFPLELGDHEPPPRDILEQEWWLAALQEPNAAFRPFTGDFPTTTLPAFHAAKAAARQGEEAADRYDLRVRVAFFADSANIGSPAVLVDLARELGLDVARFERDLDSPAVQAEVLAERRLGQEQFGVRGTPTLVLPDGSKARLPLAAPRMRDRRIVSVPPLPCRGDGCLDAMRQILNRAADVAPMG